MTENQKINQQRKQQEKRDILNKLNESKKDTHKMLRSERSKISISVNTEILNMIDSKTDNRSELIENLLIKILEKELNKKIVISKYQGL